jgi:hypothetical protein
MSNSYRRIKDALLTVSKVMPADDANHNSPTIDFGAIGPAALESIEIEVSVPAMAAYVSTAHSVTITFQDSADDSSYAANTLMGSLVIPGVATSGTAAVVRRFKVPSNARRYLQANIAAADGGANITATAVTFSVLL